MSFGRALRRCSGPFSPAKGLNHQYFRYSCKIRQLEMEMTTALGCLAEACNLVGLPVRVVCSLALSTALPWANRSCSGRTKPGGPRPREQGANPDL